MCKINQTSSSNSWLCLSEDYKQSKKQSPTSPNCTYIIKSVKISYKEYADLFLWIELWLMKEHRKY